MPDIRTTVRVGALSSKSLRAWVVAVVAAVAGLQAHAAGLGRLEVKSALGDTFRAEISVLAEKTEIAALSAHMASAEAFDRAGLIYGGVTAAIRVSVEKHANGEPYVLLTSVEKINEPVVDLLVELSWTSGRVTREYTAFVDPPFIIAERDKQRAAAAAAAAAAKAAAATTQAAASEPLPEPQPLPEQPSTAAVAPAEAPTEEPVAKPAPIEEGPVKTIGGTAPTLLEPLHAVASASVAAQSESYVPVKRGDTLSKIALQNKPSDITLEQMLVLLFRNNPDAFAGKNMNRLKTGKIIQLADSGDYAALTPAQARQEVRVQSADWKAYRERLAEAAEEQASATAEPAKQAAAGQISPKVDDQAKPKTDPKEVLKLSEGSTPGAAAAGGEQQRTRAQEEELVARDKAINEANQRVARLEKTINDLQALLEVKNQGMAELQKQAAGAAAPAQQLATKPAATQPANEPATTPATQPAAPVPDVRPQTPAAGSGPEAPLAQPAPQAAAPAPTPKPRPKLPAPPPPSSSLIDQVLEQPYYLGGAALLLLLVGFGAMRVLRRRREAKSESEDYAPGKESGFSARGAGDTTQYDASETDLGAGKSRDTSEEVDPIEEAEIFLAYGRDAQAEELLNEALASNPRRYEIHTKLLEIYAKRQDKTSFERVARELQKGTSGSGDLWQHAVKLGYQVDPSNARYAAGRSSADEAEADDNAGDGASPDRLDFDVGLDDDMASTTATDIDLGASAQFERTQIINPLNDDESTEEASAEPSMMDFNVELPDLGAQSEPEVSDSKAESGSNSIDFKMDVGDIGAQVPASTPDQPMDTGGLDFDIGSFSSEAEEDDSASASAPLDLSGISLDLDGSGTTPINPAGKDEKWYEVQTKFDLAKAYQEMGDKDGAREILREVIAEGDADQKAAAEAVLTSLE